MDKYDVEIGKFKFTSSISAVKKQLPKGKVNWILRGSKRGGIANYISTSCFNNNAIGLIVIIDGFPRTLIYSLGPIDDGMYMPRHHRNVSSFIDYTQVNRYYGVIIYLVAQVIEVHVIVTHWASNVKAGLKGVE